MHPVAWPLCVALKGLKVRACPGLPLSLPSAPPPQVPFLWTPLPVFRFQPTCLSNLRGAFAGAGQAPSTLALLLESPRGSVPCVFCCSRPLPTPVPQWVLKGSPHPHVHRLDSVVPFLPGILDAVLPAGSYLSD